MIYFIFATLFYAMSIRYLLSNIIESNLPSEILFVILACLGTSFLVLGLK